MLTSFISSRFCVKSRAKIIAKKFKETTCVFFSSFFTGFCLVVFFIFTLATDNLTIITTIKSVLNFVAVGVIWILFYGKLMYKFYTRDVGSTLSSGARARKKSTNAWERRSKSPGPTARHALAQLKQLCGIGRSELSAI